MTIYSNKIISLFFILAIFIITSCVSSSMEYRSATTAARSEKNLQKAEEWGRKALEIEADSINAHIPYFLAIEVYKPRKEWIKMAEMLDEAIKRNPTQKLERPIILDKENITKENVLLTIKEGVETYRSEEWGKLYNLSVEYFQKDEFESAIQNLDFAIKMDPSRGESYGTLAAIHLQNGNQEAAKEIALLGSKNAPGYALNYQVLADISIKDRNFDKAEKYYFEAIEKSEDSGPIMKQLIFLYIDKGENQKAIEYSEELLDKYPDDADVYFNIGVLFQRLTQSIYDSSVTAFNEVQKLDSPSSSTVKELYADLRKAREYAYNAKDYFLSASDLEIEGDGSSGKAANEMKKIMKTIDQMLIPGIRKFARSNNIDLD